MTKRLLSVLVLLSLLWSTLPASAQGYGLPALSPRGQWQPEVPSGVELPSFPFPFIRVGSPWYGCTVPAGWSGTTLVNTGYSPGVAVTTATLRNWDAGTVLDRTPRIGYATTSTAGTSNGVRSTSQLVTRGSAAGRGGFYWWGSAAYVAIATNQRSFIGLRGSNAAITNVSPDSLTDTVYFGCNTGTSNLGICSNDNVGNATCTTLGASYPCTTAGAFYNFYLWAIPNDGVISYAIQRLDSAASTTGTITGDLPRNSTATVSALAWYAWINNGTTAAAAAIDFAGSCIVGAP